MQPGDDGDEQKPEPFDHGTFEAERTAWENQGMNSYRFTAQSFQDAVLTMPFTITVLPDRERAVTYNSAKAGGPPYHSPYNTLYETGEEWMEAIRDLFFPFEGRTIDELYGSFAAYIEDIQIQSRYTIKIQYNREYHYPEDVSITIFTNDPKKGYGGGGFSFEISMFEDLRDQNTDRFEN
jgi:hypothetical protein